MNTDIPARAVTPRPEKQTAEPPTRRASRFDQRGIALQTVIIMVVLLAIAGGVAAVLLNRGSEASNQLNQQQVTVHPATFGNKTLCQSAGHTWKETSVAADVTEALNGNVSITAGDPVCIKKT